ncbi:MAG: carbohydrate ABC transporter permease [Nocardioidaceae bacterium]|nr:carbohydrate ABC transporter permease [Nocardioidaceae bacterium]
MVAPLVWLVVTSLTRADAAFQVPPQWLPKPFSAQAYTQVQGLIPFAQMALNSFQVAVAATVGSLFFSVLAAYGFSRFDFRGSKVLFVGMLSSLMVPVQLTIIPVFVMMRHLGLVDDIAALWLPALINVFQIFFLRQYFSSVPRELDEAARMDGANHLWILFRIIVPLSGPALSAMAILSFEASWNNYFAPLVFLNTPSHMTLPLGLVTLQSAQGGPAVVVFAAITMVVVPVLVVFLLFQRAFVSSIAASGLK